MKKEKKKKYRKTDLLTRYTRKEANYIIIFRGTAFGNDAALDEERWSENEENLFFSIYMMVKSYDGREGTRGKKRGWKVKNIQDNSQK